MPVRRAPSGTWPAPITRHILGSLVLVAEKVAAVASALLLPSTLLHTLPPCLSPLSGGRRWLAVVFDLFDDHSEDVNSTVGRRRHNLELGVLVLVVLACTAQRWQQEGNWVGVGVGGGGGGESGGG